MPFVTSARSTAAKTSPVTSTSCDPRSVTRSWFSKWCFTGLRLVWWRILSATRRDFKREPRQARRSGCRALGQRDQPARESTQQVDARQALPLFVRLEQSRRLVGFHPAPVKRLAELQQTQIADEPALVAAEPLQCDHSHRPRAEPPLPQETIGRCTDRRVTQALEIQRTAKANERRAATRVEAEPAKLCGRAGPEARARRRLREAPVPPA